MRNALRLTLAVILTALNIVLPPSSSLAAGAPLQFDSPKKKFHIQVTVQDAGGSDLMPLIVFLTPAAGGKTIQVNVQMAGYVAPDAARAARMFHFSPDETTVAIDNPSSSSIFGYRVVPLVPRPWTPGNVEAEGAEWADENRLVYRGQASDNFYIGVFDARTGKDQRADPSLSMYTNFELVSVTPTTLIFREEDTAANKVRCLSFNTKKGKRRIFPCPED